MASGGRAFNQSNEWDTMKEDFNNSVYDAQYPDDDVGGGVELDHTRLYIRNIPQGLNWDGLHAAFAKYGTLLDCFLSSNPNKKFALMRYETTGEAKLAMTKLNNTDPLRLQIHIAHKRTNREPAYQNRDRNGPMKRGNRDDYSICSKAESATRRLEDLPNGDDMDESLATLDDDIDLDTKLKDIQLKLDLFKVQEQTVMLKQQQLQLEAARKRTLNQSVTSSNRCILPDGRVVVRNNLNERNSAPLDTDGSFAAGAGDSLTPPALQRSASRACVSCGAPADAFCGQCGLTPYCSPQCQRRDWAHRHRSVCHNLARLNRKNENTAAEVDIADIPTAPPLRRPRSPTSVKPKLRNDSTGSSEKAKKPMNNNVPTNRNNRGNQRPANKYNNKPAERELTPNKTPPVQKVEERQKKEAEQTPPQKPANKEEVSQKPVQVQKTSAPHQNGVAAPKAAVKPPGALSDVTPGMRKLVPEKYLIELLSIGDSVLLSVDAEATACRTKKSGFVCLSMNEEYSADYQALCEDYVADCEANTVEYEPKPGETFSYFNTEDGGWYRARCLTPSLAALIDGSKCVPIGKGDRMRCLPAKYEKPEFCCVLNGDVKIGDNLKCTLVSKTADCYKVSLENVETMTSAGEGEVSRWLPQVEYPVSTLAKPQIPEVPRPPLQASKVLLVDATAPSRVLVRPANDGAQRIFDAILQDVVLYARGASPLTEPPVKGQTVIAKFSDGLHYRALCKRTNVNQNKYLLEYIEFGNMEVTSLENLYACPPKLDLKTVPAGVSLAKLHEVTSETFTKPATEYLDKLKDELVELNMTLPSGESTADSGSAIILSVAKNNESVNKKIEDMCKPEWKKIEERGGDVLETEHLMYSELEYLPLPPDGCVLDVLDVSAIECGTISGCQQDHPHVKHVLTTLTERMAEYCNSEIGKEPYLPKTEELCIARCPPYPQWFRAVFLDHKQAAPTARVCYVDYGNIGDVPVAMLRKMLPEFVRGECALGANIEIKNFPQRVTPEQLIRAVQFMRVDEEEGRGVLKVSRCQKLEDVFVVDAPDLIEYMLKEDGNENNK